MKLRARFVPHFLSLTQAMQLSTETVDELVQHGLADEGERDRMISDLLYFGPRRKDGFDVAKELDNWRDWNCRAETIPILQTFYEKADLLKEMRNEQI